MNETTACPRGVSFMVNGLIHSHAKESIETIKLTPNP